jgi:MG2 domain
LFLRRFISVTAPTFIDKRHQYTAIFNASHISQRTSVILKLRRNRVAVSLNRDAFCSPLTFSREVDRGLKTPAAMTLSMTAMRGRKCSTKSVKIDQIFSKFLTFIQLDKGAYVPGENVKFRIIFTDLSGRPFHLNSLSIKVTDPYGKTAKEFGDSRKVIKGTFEENLQLEAESSVGDWLISVTVDGKKSEKAEKTFKVEKVSVPLFQIFIESGEIFAKYWFGGRVTGRGKITSDNFERTFENSTKINERMISAENAFRVEFQDKFTGISVAEEKFVNFDKVRLESDEIVQVEILNQR